MFLKNQIGWSMKCNQNLCMADFARKTQQYGLCVPHFNPHEVILRFRIRECKQVEEENVKRKSTKEHQTLYTNKRTVKPQSHSTRSNPLYGLFQEDLG